MCHRAAYFFFDTVKKMIYDTLCEQYHTFMRTAQRNEDRWKKHMEAKREGKKMSYIDLINANTIS